MSPAKPWDEDLFVDESYADFAVVDDASWDDATEVLYEESLARRQSRDLDQDDPVAA